MRNPQEVVAHWEMDRSSLKDGAAFFVFAIVSSPFLVLLGHALDRSYGTQAFPSFGWFMLTGLAIGAGIGLVVAYFILQVFVMLASACSASYLHPSCSSWACYRCPGASRV